MVGVPALGRWLAGPSGRITWPNWKLLSRPISIGPTTRLISIAVMLAAAVRNVM